MSVHIFPEMIGSTIERIVQQPDKLIFHAVDGKVFTFLHHQSCCESVYIEDVTGDLQDLIGTPLVMAEEVSNMDTPKPDPEYAYSYTWTFYRYGTNKGSVTVRWLGTSNGYYSESVNFEVEYPKLISQAD
jgi:hypothetical protein